MKPKEPTYQVVLDALAFTTCYPAFLITAEVPVIYMHEFWATVNKHNASNRFKIDNKRFSMNVEVFREILNICHRIPGQEFDEPPSKEEALSFIRELGHSGEIKYITDVIVDHLHQPWINFTSIINKCLCGKEDLGYQIDNKDSKKQDKMLYPRFTKIIIHHFLEKDKSISMRNRTVMHTTRDDSLLAYKTYYAIASGAEPPKSKKTPVKATRGKGLNVLSEVALSEASHLKEATKRSKKDFHISQASSSGTDEGIGTKPGVPDVPKYDSKSDKECWGDSREKDDDHDDDEDTNDVGDDDGNDDDDNNDDDEMNDDDDETGSERTESDKIKIPDLNKSSSKEHDEEEYDDDFNVEEEEKMDEEEDNDVTKELYKDVNVNLRDKDADMTEAEQGGANQHNVSYGSGFEQEEKDAHVTLTTVHDKTEGRMQSSYISSDFTSKLLNLTNPSPDFNEIASLMNIATIPPPPPSINHLQQQATPTPTPTTSEVTTLFPTLPDFSSVFKFNDRVTNLEKVMSEMKQVDQEEALADKKEYIDLIDTSVRTIIREEVKAQLPRILPKAVSDFVTPMIERNIIESLEAAILAKSSSQPKSTYKAVATLSEFELTKILMDKMEENKSYLRANYKRELYDALVKLYNTDKDLFDTYGEAFTRKSSKEAVSSKDPRSKEGKSSNSSKGTSRSHHKSSRKSAHAEEPSHTVDDSEVHQNQEFDTGNNDEQPNDEAALRRDCDTARAKKPPVSFDELMDTSFDFSAFILNRLNIPHLTQELLPLILIPDHRGHQVIPRDYFINNNLEYVKGGSLSRKYSTLVTKTKAATYEIKWIEDMVPNLWIRREAQQLYTFKEGDFLRLCLQDIEDMLLLLVQQKLTNLTLEEHYDLNVALRMFTRRIVIQRRVEDLQLGVKIYQKKLNLTKPDTFRPDLMKRTAYTAYSDPQGVIYVDQNNRNRLMRTDELHKFNDGTLDFVWTALHDIASEIRMKYLPKKNWS
ncbi:hypothetical protein Tco_0610047, partial [Tanacetum coccineum]